MSVNPKHNPDFDLRICNMLADRLNKPNLFSTPTKFDKEMCDNAYSYLIGYKPSSELDAWLELRCSWDTAISQRKAYKTNKIDLCNKRNEALEKMENVSKDCFLDCDRLGKKGS